MTSNAVGDGTISWRELLIEATAVLGEANEARWLCEEVSGWRGAEFNLHATQPASQRAVARFDALLARRLTGEPLQYVLGAWAFRRLELLVDSRVLIPRPETEVVVGVALDRIASRGAGQRADAAVSRPATVRAVDLGTGSGAIALSLAAECPLGSIEVWGTDISADALDVARANLSGLGRLATAVRLVHGHWFDALASDLLGSFDLVVSNPPYVAVDSPELAASVRDWEPAVALFAPEDGTAAYRHIIPESRQWLAPGGWLVLEIGSRQGMTIAALCQQHGFVEVAVLPDLAGLDRVVVGRAPEMLT
jgi:release factor glutamine methyltransferase